jgi:Nicotinic acid phosphoribosyltransferase
MTVDRFVNKDNMSLLTDLYELTMAQVYFNKGMNGTAVFNFFIRPTNKRNYFLNAGLELLIDYLLNLRFYRRRYRLFKTNRQVFRRLFRIS